MQHIQQKKRIEVYDWIRGLACLAVIIGHLKPFGVPKVYFLWSVHAFVIVTVALMAQIRFDFGKLVRRTAYIIFVYIVLLVLFRFLFTLQGRVLEPSWLKLFFSPRTALIENPYLGHLWYIFLHFQILFGLFLFSKHLPKLNPAAAVGGGLLISQSFFLSICWLQGFGETLFIFSWLLVIAVGWYIAPPAAQALEKADKGRWIRILITTLIITGIFLLKDVRLWLTISQTRVFVTNTAVFLAVIYLLAELFYVIREMPSFDRFRKGISALSRYTLIFYIYHQGVYELLLPWNVDPIWLTMLVLSTGYLICPLIHKTYLFLENKFAAAAEKVCLLRLQDKQRAFGLNIALRSPLLARSSVQSRTADKTTQEAVPSVQATQES